MRIASIPFNASSVRGAARGWWSSRVGAGRFRAIAALIAVVVLALPILALVLVAFAALVAIALATIVVGSVARFVSGLWPRPWTGRADGRANVRVIERPPGSV